MADNEQINASNTDQCLIFACSGGSDVGEITDRAARALTRAGLGRMYCLTGVGGRVGSVMETTASAETILAINGCGKHCATHVLEAAGFTQFAQLCLKDMGFKKGETDVTAEHIQTVMDAGSALLAAATCE